ncbi:MAG: hypothetical protein Tsb0013_05880 [Phycisphaerales bacterium]
MPGTLMTPFRMTTLLAGVLLAFQPAVGALGQDSEEERVLSATVSEEMTDAEREVMTLAAVMLSPDETPERRFEAARELVSSDHPLAIDVVRTGLGAGSGIGELVVLAVREARPAPDHLKDTLIDALDAPEAETRRDAFAALTRWPDRDAVGAIVDRLARGPLLSRDELRGVSAQLREMLALRPYQGPQSDDPSGWSAWWATQMTVDESAWERQMRDRLRVIARERGAQLDDATRALREAYRRVYSLLPEEERSAFIAELLSSSRPGVRALGFDIAQQALLNARVLGPEVRRAALASADDPDRAVRRRAAALVDRLGLNGGEDVPTVLAWLDRERDTETATSLLRLMSREGALQVPGGVRAVMSWLDEGGVVLDAALGAGLALHRAGVLSSEQTGSLALAAERALVEHPTPLHVRVVGAVGKVELLLPLLGEGGELSLSAARVLAERPMHVDALIEAARSDDRLFTIVCGALRAHRAVPGSLGVALALPAPDAALKRQEVASLVASMTPADQLRAVEAVSSADERAAYLAHTGEASFHEHEDPEGTRTALSVALASARLQLRDPGGALAALDAIPEGRRSPNEAGLRAHALLWLGRIDEARALHGARATPAGAWIDALRDAIELAHASRIAEATSTLFDGVLTEQERARLGALVARLEQPVDESEPSPAVVEPTG